MVVTGTRYIQEKDIKCMEAKILYDHESKMQITWQLIHCNCNTYNASESTDGQDRLMCYSQWRSRRKMTVLRPASLAKKLMIV